MKQTAQANIVLNRIVTPFRFTLNWFMMIAVPFWTPFMIWFYILRDGLHDVNQVREALKGQKWFWE